MAEIGVRLVDRLYEALLAQNSQTTQVALNGPQIFPNMKFWSHFEAYS